MGSWRPVEPFWTDLPNLHQCESLRMRYDLNVSHCPKSNISYIIYLIYSAVNQRCPDLCGGLHVYFVIGRMFASIIET